MKMEMVIGRERKEEESEARDDIDELMTGNDGVVGRLDDFCFSLLD